MKLMQSVNPHTLFILGIVLTMILVLISAYLVVAMSVGGPPRLPSSEEGESGSAKLSAFLAAAIAITVACLSAGAAIYGVATSGFAASAERPELRTFMLILGGLAEGIAIYGLLVAIMILGKI
ncbi:MAG: hypothetical protein DRJ43_00345 [Thermoprotei archaeon]|nr:MAG: hypothetical protein DRJ43_00345 [Thermoprotei archaeon]